MTERLIIAYGTENITLNRGNEHFILSEKELALVVKSVLNNVEINLYDYHRTKPN